MARGITIPLFFSRTRRKERRQQETFLFFRPEPLRDEEVGIFAGATPTGLDQLDFDDAIGVIPLPIKEGVRLPDLWGPPAIGLNGSLHPCGIEALGYHRALRAAEDIAAPFMIMIHADRDYSLAIRRGPKNWVAITGHPRVPRQEEWKKQTPFLAIGVGSSSVPSTLAAPSLAAELAALAEVGSPMMFPQN